MFCPDYRLTNRLVAMLTDIAEGRILIERARLLPKQEIRLRRQALVRMTHSSTAIEGNILNIHDVEALLHQKPIDAPERDTYEVKNYLKALAYIEQIVTEKKPLTTRVVRKVHRLVTNKTLRPEACGQYRKGPVYVARVSRNGKREIIYTAPQASRVPKLMDDLLAWLQASEQEQINPVIVAGILHQEIAAIHPFADGNGRTARALATLVLYQRGYDFRRLFALEDYYNADRPAYYTAIAMGSHFDKRTTDTTPWLEYFVKGFQEEIDKVKHEVITLSVKRMDRNIETQIFLDKEQVIVLDFLDSLKRITG